MAMNWQAVQPFDLAQVYLAAQQARLAREQRRAMEYQNDLTQVLPEARAAYYNRNDPQMLQEIAPKEFEAIRAGQAEAAANRAKLMASAQEMQQNEIKAAQERGVRTAQALSSAAAALQEDPRRYQLVRGQLGAMAQQGLIAPVEIPEQMQPDTIAGLAQMARDVEASFTNPKLSGMGQEVADSLGLMPMQARTDPRFQSEVTKEREAARKRGGMTINLGGNQPLTTGTKAQVEQDLISKGEVLAKIGELRATFKPEYLGFVGKNRARIDRVLDSVGMLPESEKQFLGPRRQFTETINQIFDAYRKEITGAGAGVSELEKLKNGILNTDLSATEFMASLDRFERTIKRDMAIKQGLLARGIDVKTPAGRQQFDREVISAQKDELAAYESNLRTQGLTDAQIIDRMLKDNRITQAEAQELLRGVKQ